MLKSSTETNLQLLRIMKDQANTIQEQSTFIDKLLNENLEKENMINMLLQDVEIR